MSSSPTPRAGLTRRSPAGRDTANGEPDGAAQGLGLARGDQVGRYLVVDRIAAGGMGIVYHGYDPELARRVALKLLRTDTCGGSDPATLRARMLREARAMASLSHPNVVPVYDVGTVGAHVFLAMEFIDGGSLAEWSRRRSRSWSEIVDVYVAAGRGLAAAHEAGLVHGDFKPHNVLVAEPPSGTADPARVCVTDFGLARPVEDDRDDEVVALRSGDTAWFGTPGYLAPELVEDAVPDARSDQFAFCVSLFETLHGRRPFPGRSLDELTAAARAGAIVEPSLDAAVPRWLHRAVVRGLAADPQRRHPSMRALVDELARDRRAPRRRIALVGVLAAVGAIAYGSLRARAQVCAGAAEQLDGIWDDARKQSVATAFAATAVPYADDAWNAVEPKLDRFRTEWISAHDDACTATRVRHEQSEDLLDRRMLCLARQRRDLSALVDVLATADATVVEHAVGAVHDLPAADDCANPDALGLGMTVPPEEVRGEVDAVEALLARADALRRAGHWAAALPMAGEAAARADALGLPALQARARLARGRLEHVLRRPEAYATLHAGIVAARTARDAVTEAELWVRTIVAADAPIDEVERTAEIAEASVIAAGDPPLLRARLLNAWGSARERAGRPEAAIALLQDAVALWTRAVGSGDPSLSTPLINLGNVETALYRYDDAAAHLGQAIAVATEALGPAHPQVATATADLCLAELGRDRFDLAAQHCTRAIEILSAALGPDHPDVAKQRMNLGTIAYGRGEIDEALREWEPAAAILGRHLGEDDPQMARAYSLMGDARCTRGEHARGMELQRRALALREASLPAGHGHVLASLLYMAQCEHAAGRTATAIELHRRAIAMAAVAPASATSFLARHRFALAGILAADDPAGALALARTAHVEQQAVGDTKAVAEIAQWIRDHER